MGFIRNFLIKIRKHEKMPYTALYRGVSALRGMEFPVIRPLHSFLYFEMIFRKNIWHEFWRIVYHEPMFKSQCFSVGKGFKMLFAGNGCAYIYGNAKITLGSNVTMFDKTVFCGLKVNDQPTIRIGNNTYLGPTLRLLAGKSITIGSYGLIAGDLITDNPGHPVNDCMARMAPGGGSPASSEIRPVVIGDFCFLPGSTVVYPGVTIGDGVVASIGTHIVKDVPPFCRIAGNPGTIIRKLPIPPEIRLVVGDERYQGYLEAHTHLVIEKKASK